jgi:DNA-binding transcriptional ArsR family regulator
LKRPRAIGRPADLPLLHRIGTLEGLRAVSDDQRHRILALLIADPLAARAIASQLGMPRTKVYYHLKLLEKNGFIRPVEERLVGRRVERIYRAVARVFRVDTELIGRAGAPGIARARAQILENALVDFRSRSIGRSDPHREDATLIARVFVRLRPEQLAALRQKIRRLIDGLDTTQQQGIPIELAVAMFAIDPGARK